MNIKPFEDLTDRAPVRDALRAFFKSRHAPQTFVPGQTYVPASGKLVDETDLLALGEAAMDLWLTAGRFARSFEQALSERLSTPEAQSPRALFVNSGSSANLLAIAALCAQGLGPRRLRPGDEVITVAAGFPTTVNPIIQYGLIPVLIDIEPDTYNTTPERIEAAITPRTRAIIAAHTLGNPFRADQVAALAKEHGLFLIEDCCDALGAAINGRAVGTFGDLATLSFYPAHQITTGEGGALIVNNTELKRHAESLRDWGRDCWCETGKDNTCGKRFEWRLGSLPLGYDHKYVYSEIGYNFKATDLQASLGLSQLAKLDRFVTERRSNFDYLHRVLSHNGAAARFALPVATPRTEPSWFGFPLRCLPGIDRRAAIMALERAKVGTRFLFSGNIARQPAYQGLSLRQHGSLEHSDAAMNDVFWVGVHPGLGKAELDYVADQLARV